VWRMAVDAERAQAAKRNEKMPHMGPVCASLLRRFISPMNPLQICFENARPNRASLGIVLAVYSLVRDAAYCTRGQTKRWRAS